MLFKSYFTNRKQYAEINENNSSYDPVNYGVPQGSRLYSLFFYLYLNVIKHLNLTVNKKTFADEHILKDILL